MNDAPQQILLAADDPPPVAVYNGDGRSPFLLVADHAGNIFPCALGRLGIPAAEAARHIALDIGIAKLSRIVADALDAALIQSGLNKGVSYDVKNGVVKLTGDVNSQSRRAAAAKVASSVPNVQQVVNELEVKDQKATSMP